MKEGKGIKIGGVGKGGRRTMKQKKRSKRERVKVGEQREKEAFRQRSESWWQMPVQDGNGGCSPSKGRYGRHQAHQHGFLI